MQPAELSNLTDKVFSRSPLIQSNSQAWIESIVLLGVKQGWGLSQIIEGSAKSQIPKFAKVTKRNRSSEKKIRRSTQLYFD